MVFVVLFVGYLVTDEITRSAIGSKGIECIEQGKILYCQSIGGELLTKIGYTGGLFSKKVEIDYCKVGDNEYDINYDSLFLYKCTIHYDIKKKISTWKD